MGRPPSRLVRWVWVHAQRLLLVLLPVFLLSGWAPARSQGVELVTLQAEKAEGALSLDFVARINLPKTAEDALQRGVPLFFVAEAQLLRSRWYWRDERVARISRSWRLAFQPLTGAWRVSLGGLSQSHASMAEALAAVSRAAGWKLVDQTRLETGESYYVEFNYRLDTAQLPGPMLLGLGGQEDWTVGVSRTVRVEP